MSEEIEKIIDALGKLEFLEASKLIARIEETFGVDSNIISNQPNRQIMEVAAVKEAAPVEEEKSEFDVILEKIPADKKIAVLKVIRSLTGLGLKEAKALVDNVPQTIRQSVNKDEAEKIKKELEESGAQIVLK